VTWIASPRRAIEWLLHAATMDTAPLGLDRALNPPGMTVSIGEMLAALEQARQGASVHVRRVEDPVIERIVLGWHGVFDASRARALGFAAHEPLIDVVRAFIEDDLEDTRRDRGLG
jgi:nucleoside-diphosphate-sugar epimerase